VLAQAEPRPAGPAGLANDIDFWNPANSRIPKSAGG